jgi:hypothetical protein
MIAGGSRVLTALGVAVVGRASTESLDSGAWAQAARNSALAIMQAQAPYCFKDRENAMALLLLEALGALALLLFIVWWTMFSGRKKGELSHDFDKAAPPHDDPL